MGHEPCKFLKIILNFYLNIYIYIYIYFFFAAFRSRSTSLQEHSPLRDSDAQSQRAFCFSLPLSTDHFHVYESFSQKLLTRERNRIASGGCRHKDNHSCIAVVSIRGAQSSYNSRGARTRASNRTRVDGYYKIESENDSRRYVLQFHSCFWHGCSTCFQINRDRARPRIAEIHNRHSTSEFSQRHGVFDEDIT